MAEGPVLANNKLQSVDDINAARRELIGYAAKRMTLSEGGVDVKPENLETPIRIISDLLDDIEHSLRNKG